MTQAADSDRIQTEEEAWPRAGARREREKAAEPRLLQAGPALQEGGFLSLGHGRALGLETFLGCH